MIRFRADHITDLHCDGTKNWQGRFKHLISALRDENPDLVAITGDCVAHPDTFLFDVFCSAISELSETLSKINPDFYLITVPGNHDRFFFGNRFFSLPSRLFDKRIGSLLFLRSFDNAVEIAQDLFLKKRVAIFPLDSTKPRSLIALHKGV